MIDTNLLRASTSRLAEALMGDQVLCPSKCVTFLCMVTLTNAPHIPKETPAKDTAQGLQSNDVLFSAGCLHLFGILFGFVKGGSRVSLFLLLGFFFGFLSGFFVFFGERSFWFLFDIFYFCISCCFDVELLIKRVS